MTSVKPRVAIVDFGLGNLFSVKNACEYVGLDAVITNNKDELLNANAVILPGVGAFGDAMAALRRLNLVELLRDIAVSDKPLIGICLGVQLLMSVSYEFGEHEGLNIIDGSVIRLDNPKEAGRKLKVPQVAWNQINRPTSIEKNAWEGTLLEGLEPGTYMYFVHSYIVKPKDEKLLLATTKYGDINFCSCIHRKNIFACQFHPERSGRSGLSIYKNLAIYIKRINRNMENEFV